MELKEKIFRTYCSITSDIMNAGHCIVPTTSIANMHKVSLHKARKLIKELVNEELLVSDFEGGYDDDSCNVYCYRGYRLTDKGRNTTEFKQEKWTNSKLMSKCFGGSAYSYYK